MVPSKEIERYWWGYSKAHGWVVLDRNIPSNKPGAVVNLIFTRCSDWKCYEEDRNKWKLPWYNYCNLYLDSLPLALRDNARKKLINYQEEYHINENKIKENFINDKHIKYLKKYNLQSSGIRKSKSIERVSVGVVKTQ